ncbi:hypothetical protein BE20_01020 [Sorangium cellulosum]|uniref:Uncharacterized protein n=1 Tax=Sorangium cellulosum TaxID=56 RepID=A0A150SM15_SORCE|nr:hypothetical protein BE18_23905 [Sorangium cellulosum]KYF93476.1 hypothetical protein BE20_01020 [Sorangium cellulosum]
MTTSSPTPPSAGGGGTPALGPIEACRAQVLRAYFANKFVTEANGATTVRLDIASRHVLGRVIYIVVECEDVWRGATVTVRIRTNDDRLTGVTQQILKVTNGTADVQSFTVRVGDTTALNDSANACAYTNLADFANKAIVKLSLRPHARADFDNWAEHIRDAGQNLPSIGIETTCAWQSFSLQNAVERPLLLENKKVYEIYDRRNTYNVLPEHTVKGTTARKKISHIENGFTNQVKYYFFNRIDNCYEICEVTQTSVRRRANGDEIDHIPAGYVESGPASAGGDAETNYYYNATPEDRTIHAEKWRYHRIISHGSRYGNRYYYLASRNANDMVDLVKMPDSRDVDEETGANRVRAAYIFENTARKYCNPRCFAGFLGALIQLGRDVVCTGMCFEDATSYPSVSHPNGDSVDTAYLATQHAEQLKIDALRDHYFTTILRGSGGWKKELADSRYRAKHEDHLHAGEFNVAMVVVLNR